MACTGECYITLSCNKADLLYSTAHSTARGIVLRLRGGIVLRLRGGIVNLPPLYFLLNFVGDG